ncbi:MAG: hypothetical protein ACXVCG_15720, partial [Bdellovibrionota bacterium]
QLEFITAASGASVDSVRAIAADLRARVGTADLPRFSLASNEITVNGKKTGVWIDPHSPLRVRFQGRTWLYDKNVSAEKNYFSLAKFFDAKSEASLLDWIIPSAKAVSSRDWAEIGGAAAGVGVSALAGLIASAILALGGPEIAVAIAGLAALNVIINAMAGGMIAENHFDKKEIAKALSKVTHAKEFSLTCNEGAALLNVTFADGKKQTIEFTQSMDQPNGDHEYARILSQDGGGVENVASLPRKNSLYAEMIQCKDDAAATKITAELTEAIAKVKQAEAKAERPVPQPAPPPGAVTDQVPAT